MRVGFIWAFLMTGAAWAAPLPQPINCDGQLFELNPKGKIMILLASSQPLADTTREFGSSLYGWQGREEEGAQAGRLYRREGQSEVETHHRERPESANKGGQGRR